MQGIKGSLVGSGGVDGGNVLTYTSQPPVSVFGPLVMSSRSRQWRSKAASALRVHVAYTRYCQNSVGDERQYLDTASGERP